jgi:hypothetical protein
MSSYALLSTSTLTNYTTTTALNTLLNNYILKTSLTINTDALLLSYINGNNTLTNYYTKT